MGWNSSHKKKTKNNTTLFKIKQILLNSEKTDAESCNPPPHHHPTLLPLRDQSAIAFYDTLPPSVVQHLKGRRSARTKSCMTEQPG